MSVGVNKDGRARPMTYTYSVNLFQRECFEIRLLWYLPTNEIYLTLLLTIACIGIVGHSHAIYIGNLI